MTSDPEEHRMYGELAPWFHLITAPAEYAGEAAFYSRLLVDASGHQVRRVLELGSGGGNNASHMKRDFDMTLVDLSEAMLAVSRSINPECEHVQGDMRTVRLGRTFDAVFVHDAVCYMTTEDDLRRAIETAAIHCAPGGAVVIAPDYTRETFRQNTDHGGHDGEDRRALRYLEWVTDPDPNDPKYTVDYAYLMRKADGTIHVERDRHIEGLFSRETWLRLFDDSCLDARRVVYEDPNFDAPIDVFVGVRRS